MALLITKKQKNLILYSETIKQQEFKKLYRHLKGYSTITKRDTQTFSYLKGVDAYIGDLLRESQNEWKHDQLGRYTDLGPKFKKKNVNCELCDKRPIRYKYRLRNKINSRILIIGSECIKEFGADFYVNDLKRVNTKTRVAALTARVERKIPGVTNYIESGWKYPQQRKIVIPKKLNNEWMTLYNQMKVDFRNFTEGKVKSMNNLLTGWDAVRDIRQKIANYEKNNIKEQQSAHSLFDVTPAIIKWIRENKKEELYQMVQQDNGLMSSRTIHLIYEENYMKTVLFNLKSDLDKQGILLSQANLKKRIVKIKIKGKKDRVIIGVIQYSKLIELTKKLLLKETNQFNKFIILNHLIVVKESSRKIIDHYLSSENNYKELTRDSIVKVLEKNELILTDGKWYYLIDAVKFTRLSVTSYLEGKSIGNAYLIQSIIEKMNSSKLQMLLDLRK